MGALGRQPGEPSGNRRDIGSSWPRFGGALHGEFPDVVPRHEQAGRSGRLASPPEFDPFGPISEHAAAGQFADRGYPS
jgi:hypothetical protein